MKGHQSVSIGPVLELVDIERRFRVGPETLEVLRGTSLTLDRSEIVVLTGASGSGKSLFLKVAGLLDVPDGGQRRFEGRDLAQAGDDELTKLRNRRTGFVFQQTPMVPGLTVVENVALPLRYRGLADKAARERAREALARLGLEKQAGLYPGTLSVGQIQIAGIARALVGEPVLLLADEPTASLDDDTAGKVLETMRACARGGMALLIVTHDPRAIAFGSRHLILQDGHLVAEPMDKEQRQLAETVS